MAGGLMGVAACQPDARPVSVAPSPPVVASPEQAVAVSPSSGSSHRPELLSAVSSATNQSSFRFRDASSDWKLEFQRFDDMRGENRIQESIGGGVAVTDFDLDGRLDLFFAQGCRLPLREKSSQYSNEFFRNTGTFERATVAARMLAQGYFTGRAAADFNDDGFPDLYVTAYGRALLWRNNGDGTFEDVTLTAGTTIETWSTSAGPISTGMAGSTCSSALTREPPLICPEPRSPTGTTSCAPTLFPALDDALFINDGQGGFFDVTRDAGISGLSEQHRTRARLSSRGAMKATLEGQEFAQAD